MPRPRRQPRKRTKTSDPPETEWCDYEPGDFLTTEFSDSEFGRLHHRSPLHNTAGQTFGSTLPDTMRVELERSVGGKQRLDELLTDE